jgi:hypothetical protein
MVCMSIDWPERDWVTSAELAALAGVNVRTVLREIGRGNLAGEKNVGWIIARPEAERWLTQFHKYDGLRKKEG